MGNNEKTHTIYGIDFSGAANAGSKIWMTKALLNFDKLIVQACYPAKDLVGSDASRDESLNALNNLLKNETTCFVGIDTSFSIPSILIKETTWVAFIHKFPTRYNSAEDFRKQCLIATNGKEYKRMNNTKIRSPFSSYNLRMYRQTYYGIKYILYPLLRDNAACILPMQTYTPSLTSIIEVCPANTLKELSLYTSYKGETNVHLGARANIVKQLIFDKHVNFQNESLVTRIIKDSQGDALDSVIAAITTAKTAIAIKTGKVKTGMEKMLEGYIYT